MLTISSADIVEATSSLDSAVSAIVAAAASLESASGDKASAMRRLLGNSVKEALEKLNGVDAVPGGPVEPAEPEAQSSDDVLSSTAVKQLLERYSKLLVRAVAQSPVTTG